MSSHRGGLTAAKVWAILAHGLAIHVHALKSRFVAASQRPSIVELRFKQMIQRFADSGATAIYQDMHLPAWGVAVWRSEATRMFSSSSLCTHGLVPPGRCDERMLCQRRRQSGGLFSDRVLCVGRYATEEQDAPNSWNTWTKARPKLEEKCSPRIARAHLGHRSLSSGGLFEAHLHSAFQSALSRHW